jgi:hypothetical protein
VRGECWQSAEKNPPDGNKSRIPYYEGSLQPKKIFQTFKLENLILPYYELQIYPKIEKNDTKISWDYPFNKMVAPQMFYGDGGSYSSRIAS